MTRVCPGDTGKASATAIAWALLSRRRSGGSWQKGQSWGCKSLIVPRDALLARRSDALKIVRAQLPPQPRVKGDEGQVAVVAEEAAALEGLERLAQQQPLGRHLVQFIHCLPPRLRPFDH